jgi:hypothetical protein
VDKKLECHHLSEVFGTLLANQFSSSESPDFIYGTPSGATLGVEATSIYSSNTAAKLARNRDYEQALLRDPSSIHRKDQGRVDVLEDAMLAFGDQQITASLLRYEVPSMVEMLERLKDLILAKERKLVEYKKRCNVVDLIVADDQGIFYWQTPQHFTTWLTRFLPRQPVLQSGFREIYLNTSTIEHGKVSAPLKGSLFASDVQAFRQLIGQTQDGIALLCACMHLAGYGDAHLSRHGDAYYVRFGAWLLELNADMFSVGDLRLDLRDDPHPTLRMIDAHIPASLKEQAKRLVAERPTVNGVKGLLLVGSGEASPVETEDPDEMVTVTFEELPEDSEAFSRD